jgi:superfamily II DNA or RNA helicase
MTITLHRWEKAPFIFIDGELSENVESALDDELSYEIEGHEYSDAWKSGDWDGYYHLYRESKGGNAYFPLGALSRVRDVLDSFGVDYEVEGVIYPGRGELDVSWDTDMTLREYQSDAVETCLTRGRGIIAMPTGAGKTLIGLRLMFELKRPSIVLCHRQEIADQWAKKMGGLLDVDVARYYGGDRENGDFQVALYQSVFRDGEVSDDVRLDHDVLLADECHRVGAETFSDVALEVNAPYRFGMSATPEREDNATLRVIAGTGELVCDIRPENLIDQGYLAEPEWRLLDSPKASGMYRNWQDEYKGEIVENEGRNEMIAEEVDTLPKPCYVHVERIAHGERLESMIDGAKFVSSESNDREEAINAFRDGDRDVLISTLLGEGFDLPGLRSMVMAGGLKTEIGAIQKVGRALRPGTDGAVIVDCIDKGRWVGDHSTERVRTYRDYYGEYAP